MPKSGRSIKFNITAKREMTTAPHPAHASRFAVMAAIAKRNSPHAQIRFPGLAVRRTRLSHVIAPLPINFSFYFKRASEFHPVGAASAAIPAVA